MAEEGFSPNGSVKREWEKESGRGRDGTGRWGREREGKGEGERDRGREEEGERGGDGVSGQNMSFTGIP